MYCFSYNCEFVFEFLFLIQILFTITEKPNLKFPIFPIYNQPNHVLNFDQRHGDGLEKLNYNDNIPCPTLEFENF